MENRGTGRPGSGGKGDMPLMLVSEAVISFPVSR